LGSNCKLTQILDELFYSLIPNSFILVVNIIIILIIDWRLGFIYMLAFGGSIGVLVYIFKRFRDDWNKFEAMQEETGKYFCESIINIKTVKNYSQEEYEKQKFGSLREKMCNYDISVSQKAEFYFYVSGTFVNIFFYLTVVYAIYLAFNKIATIGTVVYILTTGNVALNFMWHMFSTFTRIMKKFIAVSRMQALLDEEVDVKSKENAIIPDEYKGEIRFNDVKFRYKQEREDVIKDISLRLKPLKMHAFVGRSGGGKTTVVSLVNRMYDVSHGSITLDGQDIRDLDLHWYRRLFAVVSQDVDIFDASLRENIIYSCREASDEQIEMALKASYLDEMLKDSQSFPQGIETQVGERGVELSGGQRQRVSIARAYIALLNGAKVLILDEATSNLDSESEQTIQSFLANLGLIDKNRG
jgi:subfamily B ATP-binding cassette protein MsbA